MTQEQINKAVDALLTSNGLLGESSLLPKVFIVNGDIYWFLNAARRAAYGTKLPIEVMTIEDAMRLRYGSFSDNLNVVRGFEQVGDTYGGRLFREAESITPEEVTNPIISYHYECNPK